MLRSSRRKTLIAFVALSALLFKAAMPMLAAAAATLRGVPVADVCEIYGVSMPGHGPHPHDHMHMAQATAQQPQAGPVDDTPSPHSGHDSSSGAHKGDHCALTGLAALAPPGGTLASLAPNAGIGSRVDRLLPQAAVFDAIASWAARLRHGPPLRA